jgi:hypothetical protein
MPYHTTSRAYLERARARLAEHKTEALFYAAFELRCGVEERLHEYLETTRRKREGYQIGKLGSKLEKAFTKGQQVISLSIVSEERPVLHLLYTPVRAELRNQTERLGNYLHAAKSFHADEDAYWVEFRNLLQSVADGLAWATRGSLVGPPVRDRKTGQARLVVDETGRGIVEIGETNPITIGVRYWRDIPSEEGLADLDREGDYA